MVPHGVKNAPLVIAQHGGGSAPEICSEFLGQSNYNFFTKRALERGMAVFAPQLLLWKFNIDTGEQKPDIDITFNRNAIDNKLKQVGLSITGLEVFCIRRSIDYINSLDYIDEERTAMMGLSYGGYFSLCTAAVDKRIKSIYAVCFFNDRTKIALGDWFYDNAANTFLDAEVAALCAPRRLQLDVGKSDPVFDWTSSAGEANRAEKYYAALGASDNFRFTLWDGGHRFNEDGEGFDFFFDGI
jgi:dienelactone hydrolase